MGAQSNGHLSRRASSLLGALELTWDGDLVSLPVPAQRLLAFLALRDPPVLRTYAAETLWLEPTADHGRRCAAIASTEISRAPSSRSTPRRGWRTSSANLVGR